MSTGIRVVVITDYLIENRVPLRSTTQSLYSDARGTNKYDQMGTFLSPVYKQLTLTEECKWSITPFEISEWLSQIITLNMKGSVQVFQPFAGCGQDLYFIARNQRVSRVLGIELNPHHIELALSNIQLYDSHFGTSTLKKTKVLAGSAFDLRSFKKQLRALKERTVTYMDPPFPLFKQKDELDENFIRLLKACVAISKRVLVKLPRYIDALLWQRAIASLDIDASQCVFYRFVTSKLQPSQPGFFVLRIDCCL